MTAATLVLAVLVVDLAVLLSAPDRGFLRKRWAGAGVIALAAGLVTLLAYWVEVEFDVFPSPAGPSCTDALGLDGAGSSVRHLVTVRERFFPPSVDCELAGRVVRLTPASQTARWARLWVGAWVVLGVSPLLLLAGRWRRRRQPAPRRARTSSGQGVGPPSETHT